MGATAFRPRPSSRGQYVMRKLRRQRKNWQPASRSHETPPWWTFDAGSVAKVSAEMERSIYSRAFRAGRSMREPDLLDF